VQKAPVDTESVPAQFSSCPVVGMASKKGSRRHHAEVLNGAAEPSGEREALLSCSLQLRCLP